MRTTFYTSVAAFTLHLATQSSALGLEADTMDPSRDIPDSELVFKQKRCPAKTLKKVKKNLCDGCSTDQNNGTCSVSYPVNLPKGAARDKEEACRCNPHEFAFRTKTKPDKKCRNGQGCPDRGDGLGKGTCHDSHPWYDKSKFKSSAAKPRCKYSTESQEDKGFAVTKPNDDLIDVFSQQIKVFGIPLAATSGVPEAKLVHAATVMAEYLDNNEDGRVDDPEVVQSMHT